jgi:hypothetical protein
MNSLRTKKAKIEYVRNKINRIGLCSSIREEDEDFYNELLELFKSHPDYPEKIEGLMDLKIVRNKIQTRYFEINMIKDDEIIEDISWRCCLEGKKNELTVAYRSAVVDQIINFRDTHAQICELCDIDTGLFHVDHTYHFYKLVRDFEESNNIIKPTKFDTMVDNRSCFSRVDRSYEELWQNYHRDNATLRILCDNCNLRRSRTNTT